MKLEVEFEKKYFLGIVSLFSVILLLGGVFAIGGNNGREFGHSADEFVVDDSGTLRTVQDVLGGLTTGGPGFYPGGVPSGGILAFTGSCPTSWTRFAGLDGRVPRGVSDAGSGADEPGATGGAETHTHTASYGHFTNLNTDSWRDAIREVTINPASNWPPYKEVVFCKKN